MSQPKREEWRQVLHREECLEAEIRRLRQALRNLAKAVIAGDVDLQEMAAIALEEV